MSIAARFRVAHPGFSLDVDLRLPGQGVTVFFGPSGSGKTTLLRAIAGLERTTGSNYLEVNGETWQDDARTFLLPTYRRPLGYVFQDAGLFPHLSVRRNLEYGQKRVDPALQRVDGGRVIELLGISSLLERLPTRLSGGERQRVAIARALMTSPRLLMMDEPLAALDQARKREILPYLERLHDELDIPVLYVSHAHDEVARLADHVVMLDGGRVIAEGPITETLARLDLPFRIGEEAGVVLDATIAEIDSQWHLARAEFPGGSVWVRDNGLPLGHRARIRILARDVGIARQRSEGTSILNALPARVAALADEQHPALAIARLDIGPTPLLARLTRRSAAALELRTGMEVWAQIKAVALLE